MSMYNFFPQKWPKMGVVIAAMFLLLIGNIDRTLYHFAKIALKFLLSKILSLFLYFSFDIRAENLI